MTSASRHRQDTGDSGPGGASILAVNAGSSSLKLALFEVGDDGETERWRFQLDASSGAPPDLHAVAVELAACGLPAPIAVGHRVVHGGADHIRPERVDDRLLADLEALVSFAPLHQPAALAGIGAARQVWPGAAQVACFDTAFHHTLSPEAYTLALPPEVRAAGVRRYGFHGLSYEYVTRQLGERPRARVVIAHLGAGSSLGAVLDAKSVDTTMGFTPSGGLVMATRPGDLDPGVLTHLLRQPPTGVASDADGLDELLNARSGLLGLSGHSGDVKALLAARAAGNADASLALAVFSRTVAKHVAAMAASMGGIDTLVFTGGIGQHAPAIRGEICAPLAFLGVTLDASANQAAADLISTGPVAVRVVPTDEERMIARHTADLISTRT